MGESRKGINQCCGGYAEHFEWCELGVLEVSMRRRRVIFGFDPEVVNLDWFDREADRASEIGDVA